MVVYLRDQGHAVNRKRVQRLMRVLGLAGMAPGPNTSRPARSTRSTPTPLCQAHTQKSTGAAKDIHCSSRRLDSKTGPHFR
ncbi:MAG: transposase [Chromatiaceae bacterium]|nr:transposase [Chromatiaceae bacterium]